METKITLRSFEKERERERVWELLLGDWREKEPELVFVPLESKNIKHGSAFTYTKGKCI